MATGTGWWSDVELLAASAGAARIQRRHGGGTARYPGLSRLLSRSARPRRGRLGPTRRPGRRAAGRRRTGGRACGRSAASRRVARRARRPTGRRPTPRRRRAVRSGATSRTTPCGDGSGPVRRDSPDCAGRRLASRRGADLAVVVIVAYNSARRRRRAAGLAARRRWHGPARRRRRGRQRLEGRHRRLLRGAVRLPGRCTAPTSATPPGINRGVAARPRHWADPGPQPRRPAARRARRPHWWQALDEPAAGIAAPRVLDDGRQPAPLAAPGADARCGRWGWAAPAGRCSAEYVTDPTRTTARTSSTGRSGPCCWSRRACLERLGGWDESYFLYSEETDFCLRARDARLASPATCPSAVGRHIGGGSGQNPATHAMQIVNRVRLYRRRHRPCRLRGLLRADGAQRAVVVAARPRGAVAGVASAPCCGPAPRPPQLGASGTG